jgi:hypothetical protein
VGLKQALGGARSHQNNAKRLKCDSAREMTVPGVWFCRATTSISMRHCFVYSLYYYFPTHHRNQDQHPLSSGSDRSRWPCSDTEGGVSGTFCPPLGVLFLQKEDMLGDMRGYTHQARGSRRSGGVPASLGGSSRCCHGDGAAPLPPARWQKRSRRVRFCWPGVEARENRLTLVG